MNIITLIMAIFFAVLYIIEKIQKQKIISKMANLQERNQILKITAEHLVNANANLMGKYSALQISTQQIKGEQG